MKNESDQLNQLFAQQFRHHHYAPEAYNITLKLLETGTVITSSIPTEVYGNGGMSNLITFAAYEGGVGVYEWTLNPEFKVSVIWTDFLKRIENQMEERQADLQAALEDVNITLKEIRRGFQTFANER